MQGFYNHNHNHLSHLEFKEVRLKPLNIFSCRRDIDFFLQHKTPEWFNKPKGHKMLKPLLKNIF